MSGKTRIAIIKWFGPFMLLGRPGDPPEQRLVMVEQFPIAKRGLYMFVGRNKWHGIPVPFTQPKPKYIGIVNDGAGADRTYVNRFSEHLGFSAYNNSSHAKLKEIEETGEVDSIWLGLRESNDNISAHQKNDIEAIENLLIHFSDPPLNKRDKNRPDESRVLVNYFDTTTWADRRVSKWRPDFLPDMLQYDRQQDLAIATWTGARPGVKARIKTALGPGGLK